MNKTTSIRFSYNGEECVAYFDDTKKYPLTKIYANGRLLYEVDNGLTTYRCEIYVGSYADIAYAHYRNQPTETQVQEPERLTDNLKQGGV